MLDAFRIPTMPHRPSARLIPAFALLCAASVAHAAWSPPEVLGLMTDARLVETSGLAASRHQAGRLWAHNDGGHPAELHLLSVDGQRRATVRLDGVRNTDWEDMAGFRLDGRAYLAIADTGDNGGLRDVLQIVVVEEPSTVRDGMRLRPAWTLRFRWPDGPRDCEAMTIDADAGEVLLVSKKRVPPELFRIALRPPTDAPQVAERLAPLEGIAQPDTAELQRNPVYGRYRAQITAADLSPDARTLAVLNYQAVYLYTRQAGASWSTASRTPQRLDFAWMPQAEAVAFAADGNSLWVAGEQQPSPLLRFRRESH
jgi:hypothetical protein